MDQKISMDRKLSMNRIKEERKEAIVSIALELFLKKSLMEVKMTDVADACGVGVASLYRYFGTKSQLALLVGSLMWEDLRHLFYEVFETEAFLQKSGYEQMEQLLSIYFTLYTKHKGFMSFLQELDTLLLEEKAPEEELHTYEQTIIDFYPFCEKAYETGVKDGTLRGGLDCRMIYLSFNHAVTSMGQKFIRGRVLPGDDFEHAELEIRQLIDMTLFYLKDNEK